MVEGYVEAILLWSSTGPSSQVNSWFSDRGLTVLPMKNGLLLSGEREAFEKIFAMDLKDRNPPVELPVPIEFQELLSSIAIPRPRQYTDSPTKEVEP
ncbi:MAG: hypothetical protein ACE5JX_18815 [Acidobacteriota bacterium]